MGVGQHHAIVHFVDGNDRIRGLHLLAPLDIGIHLEESALSLVQTRRGDGLLQRGAPGSTVTLKPSGAIDTLDMIAIDSHTSITVIRNNRV